MILQTVPARFNDGQVLLEGEGDIPDKARLLVTVLEDGDKERDDFHQMATTHFADSFGEEEVEYTLDDLKK